MVYRFIIFGIIGTAILHCDLSAQEARTVGVRKQLFIDNRFIEASEGITLRANPAQKLGPLTDASGQPIVGFVSRAIEDQGKIRLYLGHDGVEIFESDDALHFKSTGRSIGGGSFSTIFLDPHDPRPDQRYKLFLLRSQGKFDAATDGVYAYKSADGLSFIECGRVLPRFTDNPTIVLWDERIGKYVIYLVLPLMEMEKLRGLVSITFPEECIHEQASNIYSG